MFTAFFSGCDSVDTPTAPVEAPLFSLLAPEETGLHFQNILTEGPNTNILVYEYFYNGGGVAAADFDGDGLTDLYFTANMAPNRLYRNLGALRFADITEATGTAGRPGPWCTGVSVVDVNADGRPDLYLSYSGMLPPDKRRNQLLVNQGPGPDGTPTFRDEAARYGLDSPAFTNQAYFVDYDRDGDLDAFLLNHNPKSLPILNEEKNRQLLATPDPERGLRLLRRDGDRFTDVTEAAGINGSALSYGLALAFGDVDDNGWPDLYVSNDYEVPDYLYLNQADATFRDELGTRLGQTSHFSMGSDLADVNNDGRVDILTLDMLPADHRRRQLLMADDNRTRHELNLASGFHHQTMRNMLQLGRGDGTFAEVGRLAGVAATDWSWSALLADLDNDGYKDLHVTNGYLRDYTNQDFIKYMDDFVAARGRLQRQDVLELLKKMPSSEVSNQAFRHTGEGALFAEATDAWGLERPSNSNGAVAVDLDNDGDLELVVSNINQPAFVYQNHATQPYLQVELWGPPANPTGIGAHVELTFADSSRQVQEHYPNRGYLSSQATGVLHFGLGARSRVQRLLVKWGDGQQQSLVGVASNQRIVFDHADAQPDAKKRRPPAAPLFAEHDLSFDLPTPSARYRDFDRQALLPRELTHAAPALAAADLTGDGQPELVVGGTPGRAAGVYRRNGERVATLGSEDSHHGDLQLADLDGDGRTDVYLAAGGYHDFGVEDAQLADRVYLNRGGGRFAPAPTGFIPVTRTNTAAVAVGEHAQRTYLFVGAGYTPGRYPEAAGSRLLECSPAGCQDRSELLPGEGKNLGAVSAAAWADLNSDGTEELIMAGPWSPLRILAWREDELREITDAYLPHSPRGWWISLLVADLNADGRPDLVAGNEGLNRVLTASRNRPLKLSTTDADGNGAPDPILFYHNGGRSYPETTRDELLGQLSGLRRVYTDYAGYAGATAEEIDRLLQLDEADYLRADTLATLLFLQGADGRLHPAPLPVEAQYAPVHAITVLDADGDGVRDLLLTGNELKNRQRYGRSDANAGLLLRGVGEGRFAVVEQGKVGLRLERVAVRNQLLTEDGLLLLATTEGRILSYQLSSRK